MYVCRRSERRNGTLFKFLTPWLRHAVHSFSFLVYKKKEKEKKESFKRRLSDTHWAFMKPGRGCRLQTLVSSFVSVLFTKSQQCQSYQCSIVVLFFQYPWTGSSLIVSEWVPKEVGTWRHATVLILLSKALFVFSLAHSYLFILRFLSAMCHKLVKPVSLADSVVIFPTNCLDVNTIWLWEVSFSSVPLRIKQVWMLSSVSLSCAL